MAQNEAFARENIAYWTNRAQGYSAVNQEELSSSQHGVWGKVLSQEIQRQFPGQAPQDIQVLDIGTGPGFFAILLAEQGYSVTGVDYTAQMLSQAKKNAGKLSENIRFLQMDAEDLRFPDACFDVIVTRNVTWNLHNPENAYCQWVRVLRPGGLLLNFDANWYRYLFDEDARAGHQEDRKNVHATQVEDDTAGTDTDAMEAIARQAYLSTQMRPAWDASVLESLGMNVTTDPQIWKRVWTRTEWVNNASTPMFLVRGVKR